MHRILLINGNRCIEWLNGEPQPTHWPDGPQTHYRDLNGDVRVYGPDGRNPIVAAEVIAEIGKENP